MDTGAMEKNSNDFIHTLWDELADFDAARSDEALNHLMAGLSTLAGAWNILWMGAVRPGCRCPGFRWRCIRATNLMELRPGVHRCGAALSPVCAAYARGALCRAASC